MVKKRSFLLIWWLVSIFCFSLSAVSDYVDIDPETRRIKEVINKSEFYDGNAAETDKECDCGKNSMDCRLVNGHKQCSCEPGFTVGSYGLCTRTCQTNEDCLPGGKCKGRIGAKFCKCYRGTRGDQCDIVDECVNNPNMCGNETDVKCTFDLENVIAYCQCGKGKRFDVPQKKCVYQQKCRNNKDCYNAGVCEGVLGAKYCRCKEGTSGDYCERIDECEDESTFCGSGSDVECKFDNRSSRAFCHCLNGTQRFDLPQKKCVDRKTCLGGNECSEWGLCTDKCQYDESCDNDEYFEGLKSCHCPLGLSGELCEIVDDCYTKKVDCGAGANVTCDLWDGFDGDGPISVLCKCEVHTQKFDTDSKLCKDCNCGPMSSGCSYKAGKKLCRCKPGSYNSGDTCEDCKCGADFDGCTFTNGTKECYCKSGYYLKNGTCEECKCGYGSEGCTFIDDNMQCYCTDGYFLNNGTCEDCMCGKGKYICNFTDGKKQCHCDHDHLLNNGICERCDCGEDSIDCKFDNGRKVCSCLPGFASGNYGFCKPICSDTQKCKNGGLCLQDVCVCLAGTGGTFCEIVYDCEEKKCGKDKYVCKYDTHNQKAYCECSYRYDKFDPYTKSCKSCHCGVHSTCDFDSDGKKVCHCNKGFKERWGTCYKCDCGNYGTCIGFDKLYADRTNLCVCRPGYEDFEGTCLRCPCGENGKCEYFSSGDFNKCNCDAGYAECLNKCKLCDCGPDSKCKFKSGQKVCECPKGYKDWKGHCIDINECKNPNSCPKMETLCVNTPGSFKCECKPGYFASLLGQTYTSKLQCTKYESPNYRPWKIGYGVLSGGFILIIIGLVIIIFKIRRNSIHNQADIYTLRQSIEIKSDS